MKFRSSHTAHVASPPASRRSRLAGLVLLNALLLLVLGAVTFGSNADAQLRARSSYIMVAGGANNALSDVVYIVDTVNREMIAINYDPNTKTIAGVGYRNLGEDAAVALRRPSN